MAKISELASGGTILATDELIALRAGGNVKVLTGDLALQDAGAVAITGGTISGLTAFSATGTSTLGLVEVGSSNSYLQEYLGDLYLGSGGDATVRLDATGDLAHFYGPVTTASTLDSIGVIKSTAAYGIINDVTGGNAVTVTQTSTATNSSGIQSDISGQSWLYGVNWASTDGRWSLFDATLGAEAFRVDKGTKAAHFAGTLGVSGVLSLDAAGVTGGKLADLGDGGITTMGIGRSSAALTLGYGVSPSTTTADTFISSYSSALSRSAIVVGDDSIEMWAAGSTTTAVGSDVTMTKIVSVTSAGLDVTGDITIAKTTPIQLLNDTRSTAFAGGEDFGGTQWYSSDASGIGAHNIGSVKLTQAGGGSTPATKLELSAAASNTAEHVIMTLDGTTDLASLVGGLSVVGEITATGGITLGGTSGFLNIGSHDTLTIATGAITAVKSFQTVDTESAAAADDLITINGGATGNILVLRQASEARDVTVKHNSGGGNIRLAGGADFNMSTTLATITLAWIASVWVEISRSANT